MKKIYVVGAVTGVKNWKDKFIVIKDYLLLLGYDRIRTPIDYPQNLTQKEYMQLSCESVFWAHKIVVTKGWESSKGTRAEIALAESFRLPIVYF